MSSMLTDRQRRIAVIVLVLVGVFFLSMIVLQALNSESHYVSKPDLNDPEALARAAFDAHR